jgi:hypothetical protein
MNGQLDEPLTQDLVDGNFEMWWPELETAIQTAIAETESSPGERERIEMELLEGVLLTVRRIERLGGRSDSPRTFRPDNIRPVVGHDVTLAATRDFYLAILRSYPTAEAEYSVSSGGDVIRLYAPAMSDAERALISADAESHGIDLQFSAESLAGRVPASSVEIPMARSRQSGWTRDEVILTLDLYIDSVCLLASRRSPN